MPIDEILDPNPNPNRQPKPSTSTSNQDKPAANTKTKTSEKKLNDYAKSVAVIDNQIEQLQRQLDEQRRAKQRIVHEIKAKVKTTTTSIKTEEKLHSKSKPSSATAHAHGGYTPTPLAVLKANCKEKSSSAAAGKKFPAANEEIPRKMENSEKNCKMKQKKFGGNLSIDELFESDTESDDDEVIEPVPKKIRISKSEDSKGASSRMSELLNQKLPRLRSIPQRSKAPSVVEQLNNRYARLQQEKEAILKKLEEQPLGKEEDEEETKNNKVGTSAATAPKGEKRIAHKVEITKAIDLKAMPLEPYSVCKVPYALRSKYFALFHNECAKFCSTPEEAIIMAQQEEKSIKDRAITKGGYSTAAVHVLKRLRDAASGHASSSTSTGPKSVSHTMMLAGRHYSSITLSKKKYVAPDAKIISESEFYAALNSRYLLSKEQLIANGYPQWEDDDDDGDIDDDKERRPRKVKLVAADRDSKKKLFAEQNDLRRICCRCGTEFSLTPKGEYAVAEQCVHHWGRAYKTRSAGVWESRYSCCSSDLSVKGCCIAEYHVTDTSLDSELFSFRQTPKPLDGKDARSGKVYALDCEMVYTAYGLSLARISMVNISDDLILDILVRPKFKIVDCNTRFSGLTPEQLNGAQYDLQQAQDRLFEYINSETILIGHSLESDLKAMRLVHNKVVDTSVVYPHRLGPPYKRALKTIASEIIQLIIQEDVNGHDSKEDSSACMRLMLHKVKRD